MNCFPFEDPCVVISVTGAAILSALENGVSTYPALEGRFPQVSNIRFTFDPSRPPGSRCTSVEIANAPLERERLYTLCTREYMVRGKDGFTSLLLEEHGGSAKTIVDEENGLLISIILRQYFMSLKVLGRWKNWSRHLGAHWGGVQEGLHSVHPVREPVRAGSPEHERVVKARKVTHDYASSSMDSDPTKRSKALTAKAQNTGIPASDPAEVEGTSDSEDDDSTPRADLPAVPGTTPSESERKLILARKVVRKWWRLAGLKGHPAMCADEVGCEEFGVLWTRGIAPRVEGRIRVVGVDGVGE